MIHPLPEFPPLFPPGKWWRLFLSRLLEGEATEVAISFANRESCIKSREWMRIKLAGGTLLSYSVKGGASALKNRTSASWEMARECLREADRHAATLATIYGRTPFFALLKETLLAEVSPGMRAEKVCMESFRKVKNIILPEGSSLITSIKRELNGEKNRIIEISREYEERFDPELSIIDPLVRMGVDAIFPLLPTF